ncbi:MAG: hypothetical protein OEZ02_10355, partial [Anaerolineae bacterium]|nr:hypothetical protein [Anaerolineae bacterium]
MRRVIQFSFIIGFVLLVGSAFPQAGSAARLETAPNLYHVKPFSQSLNLDGKEIRLDLSPNPFLHPFTKPLSADIPGSWYPLGRGTTGDVSAMILNSKFDSLGNLYAGGYFSNLINADGNPVPNTYGIAVWNGNVWNAVGQGI